MNVSLINQIISWETQLFTRQLPVAALLDLIDDEFIEHGPDGFHDKNEVIRWLGHDDQKKIRGEHFKVKPISETVVLLTYTSGVTSNSKPNVRRAVRSSLWRLNNNRWQMIFHQATPLDE